MISLVKPYIANKEKLMPELEKVLYSGYIAEGEAVYKFEDNLKQFLNVKNVIAVNSGTAALHIAMLLLNISSGDEVISTPLTAEPTNTTIAITGAKVVWADIDIDTGLIDPHSIEEKITERTKAIMVVHYAGMICNMEKIKNISEKYNIPIIEDAAHAFGGKYNNDSLGSMSSFVCYSFQAIKHLTTGDGGALVINDDKYVEEAKKLRWFGLTKGIDRNKNNITRVGYKYAMNNINATIGNVQLQDIDYVLNMHIKNGKFFDEKLKNLSGIKLLKYYKKTFPVYWVYTLKVDDKEEFKKMMESKGIKIGELHMRNDLHSVFNESKCFLPQLDEFYSQYIHIPCGWWIGDYEKNYIVDAIKKGW